MIHRKALSVFSPLLAAATLTIALPAMAEETQPVAAPVAPTAPVAPVAPAPAPEAPVADAPAGEVRLAQADDMVMVSRSEFEQMKRDIEALKAGQGAGEMTSPKRKKGEARGMYVGVTGGPMSRKVSEDVGLGTAARFKDGYSIAGQIGYRFKPGFRIELEAGHQNNKNQRFVTDINNGTSEEVTNGNVTLNHYAVNAYYDIPIKKYPRLKPFIGGGYGIYQSTINGLASPSLSGSPPGGIAAVIQAGSREVHLWQYRVGIGYALTNNTELSLAYRKFLGSELKFNFLIFPGGVPTVSPLTVTGGNTRTIEAGLKFFF